MELPQTSRMGTPKQQTLNGTTNSYDRLSKTVEPVAFKTHHWRKIR
jgi:hypothetical protein